MNSNSKKCNSQWNRNCVWQRSAVKQNEFNHFVDSFSHASVHVPHFNAYEFICISSFVSNHIKTVALVSIYHCSSLPIQRDRVNAHLNCARRENHRPLRIRALPVYVCIIELTNMSAKPEYRTSRNLDTYKKKTTVKWYCLEKSKRRTKRA